MRLASLGVDHELLNEKFGTHFTDGDLLFWEQVKERAVQDEHVRRTGRANPYDKFALGIRFAKRKMMNHGSNHANHAGGVEDQITAPLPSPP